MDLQLFEDELHHNTTAQINVLRAFLPLIRRGNAKKVVFITSDLGSIETGFYLPGLANAYSVGKAALNMLVRKWAAVLKSEGIVSVLIHPGWVVTTLGDEINDWVRKNHPQSFDTKITVTQSAEGCVKVFTNVKIEETASFFNYDGTKKLW